MQKNYCDLCGGEILKDEVLICVKDSNNVRYISKDFHKDCFNYFFSTDCFKIFDSFNK